MISRYRKYDVAHRSIYAKLLRHMKIVRGAKHGH
jgi:hypothetical protein